MFNFKKKNFAKMDLVLVFSMVFLIIIGLLILYSASLNLEYVSIRTQVVSTILGLIGIGLVLVLDFDFLKKSAKYLYAISLILMVLVNIFGTGGEDWGSDNWLVLGPISFQPSEFVKLFLIISTARLMEKNYKNINKPLTLLKVLTISFIPVFLILKEDFGQALVASVIILTMVFAGGLSWKYIGAGMGLGVLSIPLVYKSLADYQKERLLNFLNPSRDIGGTGLQANQGKIAIGSGKFLGRGLFKGVQTQNNFIPEKHTDFIFPVLAEELGFVGVTLILGLYCLMLYRILAIARSAKDMFSSMVSIGVFALFFAHIFENIGMTLGLMPVTGIPLPLFSLGGTSQLVNLLALSLVLSSRIERSALEFASYD